MQLHANSYKYMIVYRISYLDFPQYFQMKTALEENNSYIGSHIDDCYQCVEKFSRFDPENYDDYFDGDNHTRKDSDLFTTSHLNQNGMNRDNLICKTF